MDSLIFDLDGTLWDSREVVARSWNSVIEQVEGYDKVITSEDFKKTMGLQIEAIGDILFADLDEKKRRALLKTCCEVENEWVRNYGGRLYEGVEDGIKSLSKNYKLFIVSNCQDGYIEAFLEYHKLGDYFEDFECPGRTGLPKGDNIKLVMERNHLETPIYIGDTAGDQQAAKKAGIPFVFAKYGFGEVKEHEYAIHHFTDLINLVKKMA
ncbi:HAD family hydrolase [Pullulanibacillus sp. KACC 23026]|uniref:HAD family hydrolase n=1 Tax=Pullulanibacillus sp. KACC 23026 TaxID=3028315 RepID=UPI0023AF3C26|nr:HAD family hydrolase [Pullulanibacillus sp. KACC 23026]WEG12188.1 HAD family hydrolase [Pullulanibacillus sp. KACC 23026]